jgi:hypothetical protein
LENTAIEREIIRNIELLTKEILTKMGEGNKLKVREYANYFDDFIDQYCLDGVHTYHKSLR